MNGEVNGRVSVQVFFPSNKLYICTCRISTAEEEESDRFQEWNTRLAVTISSDACRLVIVRERGLTYSLDSGYPCSYND